MLALCCGRLQKTIAQLFPSEAKARAKEFAPPDGRFLPFGKSAGYTEPDAYDLLQRDMQSDCCSHRYSRCIEQCFFSDLCRARGCITPHLKADVVGTCLELSTGCPPKH